MTDNYGRTTYRVLPQNQTNCQHMDPALAKALTAPPSYLYAKSGATRHATPPTHTQHPDTHSLTTRETRPTRAKVCKDHCATCSATHARLSRLAGHKAAPAPHQDYHNPDLSHNTSSARPGRPVSPPPPLHTRPPHPVMNSTPSARPECTARPPPPLLTNPHRSAAAPTQKTTEDLTMNTNAHAIRLDAPHGYPTKLNSLTMILSTAGGSASAPDPPRSQRSTSSMVPWWQSPWSKSSQHSTPSADAVSTAQPTLLSYIKVAMFHQTT